MTKGKSGVYLNIEHLRTGYVIVDNLDVHAAFRRGWQVFHQLFQLWSTNAIGTIHGDTGRGFAIFHSLLEGGSKLLVVSLLRWLSIGRFAVLRVGTANNIVKLWRGEEAMICVFGSHSLETINDGCHQGGARGARIPCKHDAGRPVGFDPEVGRKLVESRDKSLVSLGIGELCRICLPRSLAETIRRSETWLITDADLPRASRPGRGMSQQSCSKVDHQASYHGIHELDSIVSWWIVAGSDHGPYSLAIELSGSQSCEKAYTKHNRV